MFESSPLHTWSLIVNFLVRSNYSLPWFFSDAESWAYWVCCLPESLNSSSQNHCLCVGEINLNSVRHFHYDNLELDPNSRFWNKCYMQRKVEGKKGSRRCTQTYLFVTSTERRCVLLTSGGQKKTFPSPLAIGINWAFMLFLALLWLIAIAALAIWVDFILANGWNWSSL